MWDLCPFYIYIKGMWGLCPFSIHKCGMWFLCLFCFYKCGNRMDTTPIACDDFLMVKIFLVEVEMTFGEAHNRKRWLQTGTPSHLYSILHCGPVVLHCGKIRRRKINLWVRCNNKINFIDMHKQKLGIFRKRKGRGWQRNRKKKRNNAP